MNQQAEMYSSSRQSLGQLLKGITLVDGQNSFLSIRPENITLNSSELTDSSLFIAVPGLTTDGRCYAKQAINNGAAAVLFEAADAPDECLELANDGLAIAVPELKRQLSEIASRYFDDPSQQVKAVGITGTNGKTTCAFLISRALDLLGERSAMMGTIGSGMLDHLAETDLTTRDAVDTQRILRQLIDQGATAVCMEVSSHGLSQYRVDGVKFDVAVFTNLTQDHLDYHDTMQSYGLAKKKLFDFSSLAAIVINNDDELGREILSQPRQITTLSYGLNSADIVPQDLKIHQDGIQFTVQWQDQRCEFKSVLQGSINVPNLLATIATLLTLGHSLNQIASIFNDLLPPPGRMELFKGGITQPRVVVDYSHTPDSLERALISLRQHCKGKLWVVFGCGGDRDQGKRSLMGVAAAAFADKIIITNDNPRTEQPAFIAQQAADGIESQVNPKPFEIILDRRVAIQTAITSADSDDLVLVAGKGHESTQTVGLDKIPFSDRQVVSQLLGGGV